METIIITILKMLPGVSTSNTSVSLSVCLGVYRSHRGHKKRLSEVAHKWETSANENCLSFLDLDARPTQLKILISSDRAKAEKRPWEGKFSRKETVGSPGKYLLKFFS